MEIIELYIEKAAYGGNGFGHINGKTCFIPYALPGDTVLAQVYSDKKDYCFASIREIINPSTLRITPHCQNFAICGGCDYLNIEYDNELLLKKNILTDSLKRIGKMDIIPDIEISSSHRFNYRSHASVKCSGNKTGLFKKDTNTFVAFPETGCLQLHESMNNCLIKGITSTKSELKIAVSSESNNGVIYIEQNGITEKNNFSKLKIKNYIITEKECGIIYKRDVNNFFQANRFLRSKMLEIVKDYAGAKIQQFIDLGCGTGFFTLMLARQAEHGTGIDIDKNTISWAKKNAVLNKISNVSFSAGTFSNADIFLKNYELIMADPPRGGLSETTRKAICSSGAQRIIYVSCNPATFARDLAHFIKNGFTLQKLTLIDMFPCTYHIETISLFSRD